MNPKTMDKSSLMHKVLTGNARPHERSELDQWISSDPTNAREFDDMKTLYADSQQTGNQSESETIDVAWQNIKNAIDRHKRKKKRSRLVKVLSISLLISLVVFFIATNSSMFRKPPSLTIGNAEPELSENIAFHNTPLDVIIKFVETEYQIKIKTGSIQLLTCTFTGSFYRGTTLREMMHTLGTAGDFTITNISDKLVEINGQGCTL